MRCSLSFGSRALVLWRGGCRWASAAALGGALACSSTVDSLGSNGPAMEEARLLPLVPPANYPNPFRDLLGKTETEIDSKIATGFQQVFYGDPETQSVYVVDGIDAAHIRDVLHEDVRTEGMGFGMLIAVELDRQPEFDRLWNYAKTRMRYSTGVRRGYFLSSCDDNSTPCVDPFGHQLFIMALLLAHGRWGGTSGGSAYSGEAQDLLQVALNKEEDNGGIVDGVTNLFDLSTALAFDLPLTSSRGIARPAAEMPGYYFFWEQATAEPFWRRAISSARAHWVRVAHPVTGLMPRRAGFDGSTVAGSDSYHPEGYRAELNLVIDGIWTGGTVWEVEECNRLLNFFLSRRSEGYGKAYSLDGSELLDGSREPARWALNGALATLATIPERKSFVQEVWDMEIPSESSRYYGGLLYLQSLLILGGRMRVY